MVYVIDTEKPHELDLISLLIRILGGSQGLRLIKKFKSWLGAIGGA